MKISRFSLLGSRFLAADTATAGGTSVPAPASQVDPAAPSAPAPEAPKEPAPAAPVPPPDPPAPESASAPKKSNIFARASAYMQDRGALVGEIATLKSAVTAHLATIEQRDRTIAELNSELAELRAGRDQLASTVASLEDRQSNVAAGVIDAMASIGVPPGELPASQGEDASDDALLSKYESLTGGEKTEFLRKNRAALRRAASARAAASK